MITGAETGLLKGLFTTRDPVWAGVLWLGEVRVRDNRAPWQWVPQKDFICL